MRERTAGVFQGAVFAAEAREQVQADGGEEEVLQTRTRTRRKGQVRTVTYIMICNAYYQLLLMPYVLYFCVYHLGVRHNCA